MAFERPMMKKRLPKGNERFLKKQQERCFGCFRNF